MTYEFDTIINRRGTGSLKWDVGNTELPMWVADMDFPTAPEIRAALEQRAAQGIFGYSVIPDEWYRAYTDWWKTRHGVEFRKEDLIFCTGVIPAISTAVRKLTTPAEKVVLQTPVYPIFFNSVLNNGRVVLENPLKYDGKSYQMDFADLEEKLANPQTSLMILCNPHNPSGNLWDKETLSRVGELCARHHVTVISDEIHGDLTEPQWEYIPFASASPICRAVSITCIAPTKAFNLAGLQTAAVAVSDPTLRHKMWRGLNTDEVAEPNAFAVTGAVAAFTQGAPWLDALREYLFKNRAFALRFLADNLPLAHAVPSHATYLLWLDVSAWGCPSDILCRRLRESTGLYLSDGMEFGGNGTGFLRMNLACSRTQLEEGLFRLKKGLDELGK